MNNELLKETLNYELAQQYLQFANRVNLHKYIQEAEDFYNGNQYPNSNDANYLRVTLNICSFSSNIKASKVVGTPTYIKFTSDNEDTDCLKLENFDRYNCSKLHEKTENFQSALNGYNDGIDISMYRWDKYDTSYKGIYKGGLVLEHIDPLKFAVANPRIQEIQNQKWIMYWASEEVAAVKELCERGDKVKEMIRPDDFVENRDDPNSSEMNHRLVNVYTRFFKINGEVFFMCSTRNVDLFEYPHAMNPDLDDRIAKKLQEDLEKRKKDNPDYDIENLPDYKMDYEDVMIPYIEKEFLSEGDYAEEKEKFSLYPIEFFVPFKINGKFYGRSDVKQQIPIQKAINFGISMTLKCAENNAYNKIYAKEGALKGQVITNEPSQVITDYSKMTNGWGIKTAETPPLPNGLIEYTKNLFEMSRDINGYSQVLDGTISNQDVSGYAIQQMIKQANTSIEQQQQIFWEFMGKKAAIRLMFYKFFVDKAKYTVEIPQFEVSTQEDARQELETMQKQGTLLLQDAQNLDLSRPAKTYRTEEITRDEIFDAHFDISIEVEQGLVQSELAEAQMWDTLIMNGGIQNLTPQMLEMYIEANPMVSARTRQTLRGIIAKQKQEYTARVEQENAQLKSKLMEAVELIKNLTSSNDQLTKYNQNLTKEFSDKINAANSYISGQERVIQDYQKNSKKTESPSQQIVNQ